MVTRQARWIHSDRPLRDHCERQCISEVLEAAKTGPVTLEVAAARALRRLLANARGPPVRAANILHIVVEVKAVFPTRRRARWNSMAVDGARFVERGPCCRV